MSFPVLVAIPGDSVLIRAKKGQFKAILKASSLAYINDKWVTRYVVSVLNHDLEVDAEQIIPVIPYKSDLDLEQIRDMYTDIQLQNLSYSQLREAQTIVTQYLNSIVFSNELEYDLWLQILKAIKTLYRHFMPEASQEVKALKPFFNLKWHINYGSR